MLNLDKDTVRSLFYERQLKLTSQFSKFATSGVDKKFAKFENFSAV